MFDVVGFLLKVGYYYGHIIGVSHFKFDWQTGRVFKTTWSTVYAIASNVIFIMLIVLMVTKKSYYILSVKKNKLHEFVINIKTVLRICEGLITLLIQWSHQPELMILTRNALRLCLASPQVIRMSRWRIISKFTIGFAVNIFQLLFFLGVIARGNIKVGLGLGLQYLMWTMVHLSMSQHYLLMVCVRAQYHLLNTELRQVIEESKDLSYNRQRMGASKTRCCSLSRQLEDIAKLQSHLQSIVTQLYAVFGIQKLMMYCGYYASSVVSAYLTYSVVKYSPIVLLYTPKDLIMGYTWSLFFNADAILNFLIALQVQDDHSDMIRLLEERTLFASGFDARLEQSFESLQLQLLRNPFKVYVLKLFPVTRNSAWAMFGSIVLHSICLVQYDLENFGRY